MAPGGPSFEELLVQLGQAHQRELQELRSALQAQAADPAADSRPPPIANGTPASGARLAKSSSLSTRSAEPSERSRNEVSSVGHASQGRLIAAHKGLSARMLRNQIGSGSLFENYEPKFIDLNLQCLQYYPNREWDDLGTKDKVRVIREALKPRYHMINPYCYFMRVWGAIRTFTLAVVGLLTPYEVVFLDSTDLGVFLANRLIDALFLMDIILQFFLQVEVQRPHRGGSVMLRDPWTCRMRYLRSWFFIDLVSIFPYDAFIMTLGESYSFVKQAKLLRCLKLARLVKLAVMLRVSKAQARWKDALGLRVSTQKLIKFGVFLLMFSHWMACAWAFCGLNFGAELCDRAGVPAGSGSGGLSVHDMTWATTLYTGGKVSPDSPCDHFTVYVTALHWAVMTITSIGYGDIVPIRVGEYLVCIVCMIAGGVLWAYVIGSICSIISNASPVERDFEMKTDLLNMAMDEAKFPHEERDKYRLFLQEAKAYDRRLSFAVMAESFSPMLRKQLLLHISKESLASVYYFNAYRAPPSFLLDVASCLSPKFFSHLESLDHLRHSLCMIDRGTVAHCGRILIHPSVFHEDFIVSSSMFQKVTRSVALTYTQLLVLTRPDMEEMLAAHPNFMQMVRRCAAKSAFIQAVRITFAAYQKMKATIPAGSHISLCDAFDMAVGDNTTAMPVSFRKGSVASGSMPSGRQRRQVEL